MERDLFTLTADAAAPGCGPVAANAEWVPPAPAVPILENAGATPVTLHGITLTAAQWREAATPYGFCKHLLRIPVYDGTQPAAVPARRCAAEAGNVVHYTVDEGTDWQRRVFEAMDRRGSRVSLLTANGSGKTSVIATGLILWHLFVFPNSLVISTAGVARQVRSQLWPELERHAHRLPGFEFHHGSLTINNTANGSRYVGFTTDDPGKAEGWHGLDAEALKQLTAAHKGPLMILVDEAKSIPVGIFEAFDRCTYQRLLYCSSAGVADGEFWKSQTAPSYPFQRFVIPARLCPHADHAKNAVTIGKRGIDHPLVRSAIFAEFVSDAQGYVLTADDLDRLRDAPPPYKKGERAAFVDFAAGGDENVVALREGNRARIVAAWREKNTMAACAEFIRLFKQLGLEPEQIMADADGLGTPMLDRLDELGWPLNRCRNGQPAHNKADYFNWGSETWLDGAAKIKRREVILEGIEDDELRGQLLGRRQAMVASGGRAGVMRVEAKADMAGRGMGSPDRADALLGCLREPPNTTPVRYSGAEHDAERGLIARALDEYDDGRDLGFGAGAQCF